MSRKDNLKYNKKFIKKLNTTYGSSDYVKYENYDAIEVPFVNAIPSDYEGMMGVPVSFIDKYCPEQFEIIGLASGNLGKELNMTPVPREIDAIKKGHSSLWTLYIMNDGKPVVPYTRIIIRHRR